MFFLLLAATVFNYYLISKFLSSKPILFVSVFTLLLQPVFVLLRFWINPIPYDDPTLSFSIDYNQSYTIMFLFSLCITFLIIPGVIFIRKLRLKIFNLRFGEIIGLVLKNKFLISIFSLFYPAWPFMIYFAGEGILNSLCALGIRFFGAAWFFLPFLPRKFQTLPITLLTFSLPLSFATGNRTSFAFPIVLYFVGYVYKFFRSKGDIFSISRNLKLKINIKALFFILSIISVISLSLFLSIIIRTNREIQLSNIYDVYRFVSSYNINPFLLGFQRTIDRLILWQFISAIIVDPLYGFQNIIRELFIVFEPVRHSLEYVLTNNVNLGLLNFIGINQDFGYTWPVTSIVEGAIRFGYFGATVYYLLFLCHFILVHILSHLFGINKLLFLLYFLTACLININQDSLATALKTSLQFLTFSFVYTITIKVISKRS